MTDNSHRRRNPTPIENRREVKSEPNFTGSSGDPSFKVRLVGGPQDGWNDGSFIDDIYETLEDEFIPDLFSDAEVDERVLTVTEGGYVVIRDSFGNYEKYDPYRPENVLRALREFMPDSVWSLDDDEEGEL